MDVPTRPRTVENPDPIMATALSVGLHPDHPLQKTYGHEVAAQHVAFANRVASSIRQFGGVTVPADPEAEMRPVGDGTVKSDWFSVGGAPSRQTGERHPEITAPIQSKEELPPTANTPETRAALQNIVRTQNENLDRMAFNLSRRDRRGRIAPGYFLNVEVGGWESGGRAVHDVASVMSYRDNVLGTRGPKSQREVAEDKARAATEARGEDAYFDARTGQEKNKDGVPLV